MNRWTIKQQRRIIAPVDKYIPKPVKETVDAIPIARGVSVPVFAIGDLVFGTCVEILAKKMAQTKWSVYGSDNKEIDYLAATFNNTINLQPYYGINAYSFWEYMEKQRNYYGNAFAYICGKGMECRLVPLDAQYVTMYWDDASILDANRKIWYQYRINDAKGNVARTVTIPAEDILHFKAFSANGLVGRRAIDVLGSVLQSNAEVEGVMRSTVVNGYAGTILLNYTSDLSESNQRELLSQIKKLMGSVDHTIIPLPAGVEAKNISNDVKSYHEILKNANAETISAFFGIPLAMLNKGGGSGMATFSTNQMAQFYNGTIAPIVAQYANELTIKLLSQKQINRGFYFDISSDVFDFLDAQAKSSVLNSYVGAGILTPNEARKSLLYTESDDPMADRLTQRGGAGMIGDAPGNEGGRPASDD